MREANPERLLNPQKQAHSEKGSMTGIGLLHAFIFRSAPLSGCPASWKNLTASVLRKEGRQAAILWAGFSRLA